MMKHKFTVILTCLIILLCGCGTAQKKPQDTGEFRAAVVSDLHYTQNSNTVNTIVPLISEAERCYQAFFRQVIEMDPDVLIITGDNTNSGSAEDETALFRMLKQVKDAGIRIVMTTGNHDFNNSGAAQYEKAFFPLFDIYSRDETSLSYSTLCNGVLMLAMDDCTYSNNTEASFSNETMKWMKAQLKKAEEEGWRVLFCSHHSVLSTAGGSYTISNPGLASTLKKSGVKLCLTGHQHSQSVLEKDGLYEIISAMPLMGAHLFGELAMNDTGIHYHTRTIDFETYGDEELKQFLKSSEETSSMNFRQTFTSMFNDHDVTDEDMEGCLEAASLFMNAQAAGTLGSQAETIRNHPYYEKMLKALETTNYGPWIKARMADPSDSDHLDIAY